MIDDATAATMRRYDQQIAEIDAQIADHKGEIKSLRDLREKAFDALRELVRGQKVLPLAACEHGVDITADTCDACEAEAKSATATVVENIARKSFIESTTGGQSPADIQAAGARKGRERRAKKAGRR